ncbi:MAG: hypothetical protein ABSG67_04720 [Thermoguttaceae bacterium]|jgi:hypothetical protein
MIRVVCPSCGSKLSAKDKHGGQTKPCPQCGQPIYVPVPEGVEALPSNVHTLPSVPVEEPHPAQFGLIGNKQRLQTHVLERLNRQNRYWVCDPAHVIATWANDGKGWLLKTNAGMVSASRFREKVPCEGNFVLVELKMETPAEGMKLQGITAYKLPLRWALPAIAEGDDAICAKIAGYGTLSKEVKGVIRLALKEHFMYEIWEGATKVLEFLNSPDFHTHSVEDS